MARGSISRAPKSAADSDPTRARLIEAAGEVFARDGFQAATVREICAKAGANIAAVNYHFGDKTELYLAVMRESICAAQEEQAQLLRSGKPEDALSALIHAMLRRIAFNGPKRSWHFRIMAHEMVAPTPAFARVVDEVIGPQYERLRGIVASIIGLPPTHEKTRLASQSVIAQVLFYAHARHVIERLWPGFEMNDRMTARIGDHIAEFSLCSLRDMKRKSARASRSAKPGARPIRSAPRRRNMP